MQLSAGDRRQVSELIDRIGTVSSAGRILPDVVGRLRDLLDSEHALAYRVSPSGATWSCDFAIQAGFNPRFRQPFTQFLQRSSGRYGWFDPIHPEPAQRNRVVQVSKLVSPDEFRRAPVTRELLEPLGLARMDQLRTLVCDRDLLLSYVGVLRRKPFTERDHRLFGELVGPLRLRLQLEQQLQRTAILERGLVSALELIPAPVYLLRRDGSVELANQAGQVLLPHARPPDLHGSLRLSIRGLPGYSIALRSPPRADALARLAAARARFGLTSREAEVLHCLVRGDANKTIAERLGRAEVTVERHVTSLLRKLGADSRTALLARFWSME
jgi:DNA-binding CsgD family transcriptional regulator